MSQPRKLLPNKIFTNDGDPLSDTVLIVDGQGTILAMEPSDLHDPVSVERLNGFIVPGFINAHCHLELSHMKGKIATGTGLVDFIESVVSMRGADQSVIDQAIHEADREMYHQGIVAVGDICNRPDTFTYKDNSEIFYYSFVEMFDFWQDHLAEKFYVDYKKVYDLAKVSAGHRKSAVPHAPYSVSRSLFQLINNLNRETGSVSIHNQETSAEDLMFRSKQGRVLNLFEKLGFNFDHFNSSGKASIYYALEHLDSRHRHLFVHNTLTQPEDVVAAHEWNEQTYWVSCPNANLYIENRLPDYRMFLDLNARVCLGTDSLTSNWQLSILEEIKTISRYQSFVPFEELIRWATLNGAEALGIADRFGSIRKGKMPGLNLISVNDQEHFDLNSTVKKLF